MDPFLNPEDVPSEKREVLRLAMLLAGCKGHVGLNTKGLPDHVTA